MLDKGLLFEHLLSTSPDILIFFDASFQVQEMSEEARKIFAFDKKVETNKNLMDFFKKCEVEEIFLTKLKKISHGKKGKLPTTAFSYNGKEYLIDWDVTVLPKKKFSEDLFFLKGINIVENHQISQKLQELQHVFLNLPGVIFWKDKNFSYKNVNNNFLKFSGFSSHNEIIGKTDFDFPWKDQAASFKKDDMEVIQSGKEKIDTDDIVCVSDNSLLNVISNKSPLKDKEGNIIGILGVAVDITGRKQYENTLHKTIDREKCSNTDQAETLKEISKEVMGFDIHSDQPNKIKQLLVFLRAIVANMPGNVYWKDVNSVYMGGNNNVVDVCSLSSRADIAGLTDGVLEEKLHWEPGTAARFRQDDIEVINSKKATTFEDHFIQADSKKVVMLTTKTPVFDDDKKVVGVLAISMNITELKQQELALQMAKEKAEAASKAKTEFLENMRHDIRTPLTGIIGFSEIIKKEATDPKMKEYGANLTACGYALLDLLNEVLESIKVSSGEIPLLKKKFDLKKKLNDVILLNQAKAHQKNLELSFEYDSTIPQYLIGDSTRIHRIVLELVANALNFTHKGHVKLSGHLAKDEERNIIIKITVEDTGIGIEPEKQQEIYVQFKRLTPSYEGIYKGFGLGLSNVKQFVDELDGEIYVESQVGVGSKFTFIVKLKKPLLDEALCSEDLMPLNNGHKLIPIAEKKPFDNVTTDTVESYQSRILVVEDSPVAALIVTNMLFTMNCKVDVADKGRLAVQLAKDNQYDLIFMDIGLPDIDGYEVTKRIRIEELNREHVPIIALTAHVDDENKKHCIGTGMNAVLTKPLAPEKAEDILNSFIPYRRNELKVASSIASKNDRTLKNELLLLDFEFIEEQYANDEKVIVMLNMLLESLTDEEKALDSAHKISDWPTVQSLSHRLKGGMSYCGANRLIEACTQLDCHIREGKKEFFEELYDRLSTEISATREAATSELLARKELFSNKKEQKVQTPKGKTRVLLIEDQEVAAQVAKFTISQLDCLVDIAENGKKALKLAQENQYDLIFMDIGLPDINGFEVTKRLRAKERKSGEHVPIIALTAHIDIQKKQDCIEAGMDAFLSKPLSSETAKGMLDAFIPTRESSERKKDSKVVKNSEETLLILTGKSIDADDALLKSNGNSKLAKGMLHMLVECFEKDLPLLVTAKDNNNWDKIREIIHSHRGNAVYCGTPRFSQACAYLEEYLLENKTELRDQLYQQVLDEMALISKMKPLCT